MLTPFDDYPIHQTPAPIAQPLSADPNHYDRYWFNGYEQDGEFFLGGAMGHYPNRQVIDAQCAATEDVLQLIRDQSVTMRDPQQISDQLETLVQDVEQTEQAVKEVEAIL